MPISLGSITFGFGADTTLLRRSISDITNFGTQVEAMAAGATTAGTAVEAAFRRQEQAMISALQQVQKYNDKVTNLRAPANLTQGLNQLSSQAITQLTQRMSQGQLTALQYQREMERFGQTMTNATRIMNQWSAAQKQAQADSMIGSLQKLSSAAVLVYGPLSGIATRISVIANLADHFSLAWAGAIAGVAGGAYAFLRLSEAIVGTERSLQNISNTLQAVYGNATIANLQFSYLADLSNKTGVSFNTLAKQYSQIEAAAKGTSLEGERVQKVFEAISFAGTKLGLSNEELEGTFRAIQQMISKGTIQMEELKGQLGDRLPGALQVMAQALGVSTLKLDAMIKKGDVGVSSLTKFADALLKRYDIDTSQKIDTIAAAEGRLQTARTAAIDSLDKILGVSTAYKNTLNLIADGLTGVSKNSQEVVRQVLQVAAAFAAAFAAPLITAGIQSLTAGLFGIARVLAGLSTASALASLTSFGKVLTTLAIATAAYYGSAKLIDDAMESTKQSFLNAKPPVEEYLAAQQKMISTDRKPTLQYLEEQNAALEKLTATRKELADQATQGLGKIDLAEKMGATSEQLDDLWKKMGMGPATSGLQAYDNKIAQTQANIKRLNSLLAEQTAAENKPRPDPTKDLTTRQTQTIKKAEEDIRNLKAEYDNLFLSPAQKQFADTQEAINHGIENFRIGLERAEIPADKVKSLTEAYGKALTNLKEGENILKNQRSAFQSIADVFGRGLDSALSNFTDVLVDGKDKMLALTDVAKAVVKDIINTFMKLAVLAPLKNYLFGTNETVLGGNAGIGGALGSFFGGGSSSAQLTSAQTLANNTGGAFYGPGFANGGIMTQYGPLPLRKYAGGGIARSPQLALYGEGAQNEAYVPLPDGRRIPVAMQGGGDGSGGGIELHIHEPDGHKSQQTQSQNSRGGTRLDVEFVKLARTTLMDDIANGGPIGRSMEKQYGLNRAKGIA